MTPFADLAQMTALAARGLGKVDAMGVRGITLVSMEETAAMACLLAAFGLVPVPPGSEPPVALLVEPAATLNRGASA